MSKYTTLTQAQKAKKEKMCLIIAELLQNRKQKTPYSFLHISFLDKECLFFEEKILLTLTIPMSEQVILFVRKKQDEEVLQQM